MPCVHYAGPYQQAAERTEGKGRGRANVYTLTAQDLHGVIILEDEQTEESVVTDIAEETGLLDPNGCGKTLRVGGAEASQRNITTNTLLSIQGGGAESNRVSHNGNGQ